MDKWRVEFMVNFSKHYFVYAKDEQDAWEKADEVMARDTTITPRFATEHIEHTECTRVYPRYEVGDMVACQYRERLSADKSPYGLITNRGDQEPNPHYTVQFFGEKNPPKDNHHPCRLRSVAGEEAQKVRAALPEYTIVAYIRAEADEPEIFSSLEDAQAELEHLEAMNDGETTYEIEEVVDG